MADEYLVRVRIGAGLDTRSFDATFTQAEGRAKKAASAIAKATVSAERGADRERVAAAKSAEKEIAAISRAQLATQRAAMKQFNTEWLNDKRAAAKEEARIVREAGRAQREELKQTRTAERAAQRERERFAFRTSQRFTRFMFPRPEGVLGYASRTASGLMRGLGVDMSLGGGVGRAVALEKQAQTLANQAYQPGQAGAAGQLVSHKDLMREAHAQASRFGTEGGAETIIGGQTKFNKLTGDLAMARKLTGDIAELSAATGASFEDSMGAAAVLSRKLGEIPDKEKKITELMRGFAWQGKLGAVEISDLANTMPRLLSGVTRFAGDTGMNIAKMGALAQLARGGPAGTAREAATGVARMTDLFVTPARVKAMQKAGLKHSDLFDKSGLLNDPFEIIKKALTVTKGDPLKLKTMFSSIIGSKPTERLADIYRQNGGGATGIAAVNKEFGTLMSGSGVGMSKEVVAEMARKQAETSAAKAQKFQDKLDQITESLASKLLPSLEKLAPEALKVAEGFNMLVEFTANHLPSAIALGFAAAIARAGIESSMRMGIDRMLGASSPAMASWNSGFKTFGGGLGTTTKLLGTFGLALGATSAALSLFDEFQSQKATREAADVRELDQSYQIGTQAIDARKDLSPQQKLLEKRKLAQAGEKRLQWIESNNGIPDYLPVWLQDQKHVTTSNIAKEMHKEYGQAGAENYTSAGYQARTLANIKALAALSPVSITADMISGAFRTALSSLSNLPVRITNASDIKSTGPAVTGRVLSPGERAP